MRPTAVTRYRCGVCERLWIDLDTAEECCVHAEEVKRWDTPTLTAHVRDDHAPWVWAQISWAVAYPSTSIHRELLRLHALDHAYDGKPRPSETIPETQRET